MPVRKLAPFLMILLLTTAVHAESADDRLAKYRTPAGRKVEIAATCPTESACETPRARKSVGDRNVQEALKRQE